MKRLMFAVLAVMLLTASNVFAQTVEIKGYGPKQYAVVGEIEDQAKKFADSLTGKKFSHIVVEGMADRSGDKAGNEEYGSKRAKDMQAYLAIRFPNVKIIYRSLGDSENVRQVRITVMEYIQPAVVSPAPVQTPKQTEVKPIFPKYVQLLGSVILILIFVALVVNAYYSRKKAKNKTQITVSKILTEKIPVNGYIVKILCVPAKKMWYSQFRNKSGGQIFTKSRTDIISSISRCLENPKFSEQLQKLLESGEVKKLND